MKKIASVKDRVTDEANDLDKKIKQLSAFLVGPLYRTLEKAHRRLLTKQLVAMSVYSEILHARIKIL